MAGRGIVRDHEGNEFRVLGVVGSDVGDDLAILKIDAPAKAISTLGLEDELPEQGQSVVAIGSPKGLEQSVSVGIVSAIRAEGKLIQHTASTSQGSSGGPLINRAGEVVGVHRAVVVDGDDLRLATPTSRLLATELSKVTPLLRWSLDQQPKADEANSEEQAPGGKFAGRSFRDIASVLRVLPGDLRLSSRNLNGATAKLAEEWLNENVAGASLTLRQLTFAGARIVRAPRGVNGNALISARYKGWIGFSGVKMYTNFGFYATTDPSGLQAREGERVDIRGKIVSIRLDGNRKGRLGVSVVMEECEILP